MGSALPFFRRVFWLFLWRNRLSSHSHPIPHQPPHPHIKQDGPRRCWMMPRLRPLAAALLSMAFVRVAAAAAARRGTPGFLLPTPARSLRIRLHSTSGPSPHLSLVFDINKTILLDDPAGGKDVHALLNEAVSELAYGRCRNNPSSWVADESLPLHVGPPPPPAASSSLLSYSTFVHQAYPDTIGGDLKRLKKQRDDLKGAFTLPGQPGARFASEVTALEQALRLPPTHSPGLLAGAGLEGRTRVSILPAFFHFLQRLQQRGEGFALQFRTFGDDLPRVIQEYNAFVRGQHPLFVGQGLEVSDEVDHALDLENDKESFGCMYRDAEGPPVLILGTFHPPDSRDGVEDMKKEHRVVEGIPAIHAFVLQRQASERPTLAVRDYWPWWRGNLEAAEAGKLVTVPPLKREGGWFTVVLDDNIEHERAHIVDLRCAETGAVVPFARGVGHGHLVRAEPYLAIRDPENYFWECVQASLRKREQALMLLKDGEEPPPMVGG